MKKLALLLFLLPMAAMAVIGTPYSNFFDNTGTLQRKDQEFIFVKNGSGASIVSGHWVRFSVSSDDGATVSHTTDGYGKGCFGVETIAAGKFGRCQVFGYHSGIYAQMLSATASPVAGRYAYPGITNGYTLAIEPDELTATQFPIAMFLDTANVSGTVEAIIFR